MLKLSSVPAILVSLLLVASNGAAQELERYRVPQAARQALVEMKAQVHHGSAGGDFTADLTPTQAATLRDRGFQLQALPSAPPSGGEGALELGSWTSHAQMRADFLSYAATYPSIAEYHVLGYSVQNREIFALRISDNVQVEENEPEMLFCANIHGDEYASGEIAYDWAMELLDGYGSDPVLTGFVDDNEIWVVPLLNPDGHELGTRSNANGVDLNRDFGWNWDGWGGSPAAYSQVETRVLQDFLLENNITLSVTGHCSGNVFLYPWCDEPNNSPEDLLVREVGSRYSIAANYQLIKSWTDYETHGELLDVIHGGHGALCYTAEISNSLGNYADSYGRNKGGMDAFCEVVGQGMAGLITDAQTGNPLRAAVFISGSPFPSYSDPVVGDVHRMVSPGTYSATVWASGYQPLTVPGISVALGGTTNFQAALQPGGSEHAFLVTSVNQRDPNNAYNNTTAPTDALGPPDGLACSLGREGFIVLDLGAGHAITDGPGSDFTITEAIITGDLADESFTVYAGNAYVQETLIGAGVGTTSFDLSGTGVVSTRYLRIVDGGNGSSNDPLAGFELDALTVLNGNGGAFVNIGPGTGGAFGVPSLTGTGDLTPSGAGFTLSISNVAPNASGIIFVSLSDTGTPVTLAGVTFHLGIPWILEVPLGLGPSGALDLPATVTPPMAGLDFSLQGLWADPTGPTGVATGTNGLRLEIP
jgi:hypothetical protein